MLKSDKKRLAKRKRKKNLSQKKRNMRSALDVGLWATLTVTTFLIYFHSEHHSPNPSHHSNFWTLSYIFQTIQISLTHFIITMTYFPTRNWLQYCLQTADVVLILSSHLIMISSETLTEWFDKTATTYHSDVSSFITILIIS